MIYIEIFVALKSEISNICRRCHGISNKPKATKKWVVSSVGRAVD
ncbi:hypothetical protein HMPREF1602_04577, partial [Escherichia coli 907889]